MGIDEQRAHEQWRYEQNRAIAERQHDNENEFGRRANEAAVDNASFAIRSLLLINGGAGVALLAFIGALVSKDSKISPDRIPNLAYPLTWFAWGVAFASAAAALAYLTNYCIAGMSILRERSYESPFVRDTSRSICYRRWAFSLHLVSVLAGLASLFAFLYCLDQARAVIALLRP